MKYLVIYLPYSKEVFTSPHFLILKKQYYLSDSTLLKLTIKNTLVFIKVSKVPNINNYFMISETYKLQTYLYKKYRVFVSR